METRDYSLEESHERIDLEDEDDIGEVDACSQTGLCTADFFKVIDSCVAAFDYKDKTLGVAVQCVNRCDQEIIADTLQYYRSDTKKLYLASEVVDEPPFDRFKSVRLQIEPGLALLSSRAQDAIADYEDVSISQVRQEVRPFPEFSAANALTRIGSLLFPYDVDGPISFGPSLAVSERHARQAAVRLAGHIDLNAVLSLGCINTLITHIERRRSVGNIRGEEYLQSMIESIEMFLVHQTMVINSDAIYSLQIFQDETHPNFHTIRGKEALSLYGILNLCRTINGKALLRQWFLMPSMDLSTIRARHDAIECFLQTINVHFSDQLCQKLKSCGNMRRSVANLREGKQGSSKGGEWKIVLNFVFHALQISEIVVQMKESTGISLFERVRVAFEDMKLRTIAALITDVIDFDESELEDRIVVKRLVDDQLDEHKKVYDSLEQILTEVCQELSTTVPTELSDEVQCVYLPQLGFLILMPALAPDQQPNEDQVLPIWQGESWELHFSTEQSVYFKNDKMSEL